MKIEVRRPRKAGFRVRCVNELMTGTARSGSGERREVAARNGQIPLDAVELGDSWKQAPLLKSKLPE